MRSYPAGRVPQTHYSRDHLPTSSMLAPGPAVADRRTSPRTAAMGVPRNPGNVGRHGFGRQASGASTVATGRARGNSIILLWVAEFLLQSGAFENGEPIPRRHSCGGEDLSPPLSWSWTPPTPRRGPSPTGSAGGSTPAPKGLARGRRHLSREATISARAATAAPARRPAMAGTATSSGSTRSTSTQI